MRSVEVILAFSLAGAAWAAPKKGASAARASRSAPETVYVQVTPPRESRAAAPAPEREYSPAAEPETRRPARNPPLRGYGQAAGLYLGFYSADVVGGTNPYANAYYNMFPNGQPYFFEFGLGFGKAQSGLARHNFAEGSYFENPFLFTFDALVGYGLGGGSRSEAAGLFPYLLAGLTSVYQGGSPNIGAVVGFGNRTDLPWINDNRWVLNYGMRDHIYSQRSNGYQAMTQNFVLLVGVQKYF